MERHIGCILLAQRDVLAKHSWVRSSRRVYPGSRNALLSSYAWCAKLAGRTLCKEKERLCQHIWAETHQCYTRSQGKANATVPQRWVSNMS